MRESKINYLRVIFSRAHRVDSASRRCPRVWNFQTKMAAVLISNLKSWLLYRFIVLSVLMVIILTLSNYVDFYVPTWNPMLFGEGAHRTSSCGRNSNCLGPRRVACALRVCVCVYANALISSSKMRNLCARAAYFITAPRCATCSRMSGHCIHPKRWRARVRRRVCPL